MSDLRERLRELDVFAGDLPGFDVDDLPAEPRELFVDWLLAAVRAGVREPHAMTLSTLGEDGHPAARVLILKDVSADGWHFAADSAGRKGRELARHPAAALTFYWSPLARQVRIRGQVAPGDEAASAADFLARSPGARAEVLLGRQSTELPDPAGRDAATEAAVARVESEPGLVVPTWTRYVLRADSVEFWQGDPGRRHTRVAYTRHDEGWKRGLLWP
jgi:pyridoxamine 5'-phosphate oxidase